MGRSREDDERMRFVDPMKDTPEGKLLAIVRDIEKAVGIRKNSNYNTECNMGCAEGSACKDCYPELEGVDDYMNPKKNKTKHGITKYVQESSVDNVKPTFVEISGKTEIPATGYTGNQVLPYSEDGPSAKPISEVFKMPSVSQTGYDKSSSSTHMHYNDGGDYDYRAKIEESLATIKKDANAGQLGLVHEIAGQIEAIYSRL